LPNQLAMSLRAHVFRSSVTGICLLLCVVWPPTRVVGDDAVDFNRDIRPILSDKCLYCHGQDANHRQADLRLDERASALAAGVIVPGDSEGSELLRRVLTEDPDELMPPPDSNRQLAPEQKQLLRRWIDQGAPYATHWAYATPQRPALPEIADRRWVRSPLDHFVLAQLEAAGLTPAPQADRATLLKRISVDLIGLPPTDAEISAFLADTDPLAYERQVERLLASPHYGERVALPWLDAARYADSNGFQQDGDTWQWIWRDWVVRAMNADLPFDQFTIWQLAGDLLPNPTTDQLIASGFNRNHLLNGEGGAIAEEQRFVNLFDRIDTTATTWLGLTIACAQCHDHKYDPITQQDYYQLMDAFNRVPERGAPTRYSSRIRVAPPIIELPTPKNIATIKQYERQIVEEKAKADPQQERIQQLENQLAEYRADQIPRVMVMSDEQSRETHILNRGQYLEKLDAVSFNTPSFLPPLEYDAPRNRLGLAHWLVSPQHPLTARVQVNRIWQHFFGAGIVKTTEDFGMQSEYPVHRDLLDWLAVEFQRQAWSVKTMHRMIVTSATYRQTSRATPELLARDPENRLYGRASRFRMPSLILRDWALAAAGILDPRISGQPVYPYQPDNVWEPLAITKERDFTYPASDGADLYRRSLYTFWRRTVGPANMFDTSNRQTCRVRQSITSTPLHALTTLNDPTWVEAARLLAARSMRDDEEISQRLYFIFRRVVCRAPRVDELAILQQAYQEQWAMFVAQPEAAKELLSVGQSPQSDNGASSEHAALTVVCLGVFNLDEALSRE
jgi:hypothetical protein